MSPEVAAFLLDLVCRQQLNAGADDLVPVAFLVAKAKTELHQAISGTDT